MNRQTTGKKSLRCGFTTGAAAAAAGVAAYCHFTKGRMPKAIDLLFPDGQSQRIQTTLTAQGEAQVIKDAGDDPDVTDKAKIRALFSPVTLAMAEEHDYLIDVGLGKIILHGGPGVGLCGRIGLDCEKNKWAINQVPRLMIAENLARAGFGGQKECGLLTISVVEGQKLAQKTLNAQLGITNGISILGTSGIVYPYSHKAYIKTIEILVKAVAITGFDQVIFTTGGRTLKAATACLPEIESTAFIRIGDFIYESLQAARIQGISRAVVACMPGKLCKYAAGYRNTHAANVSQTLVPLAKIVKEFSLDQNLAQEILGCNSVRQALTLIPDIFYAASLRQLAGQALATMRNWTPTLNLRLLLFDYEGNLLIDEFGSDAGCARDLLS